MPKTNPEDNLPTPEGDSAEANSEPSLEERLSRMEAMFGQVMEAVEGLVKRGAPLPTRPSDDIALAEAVKDFEGMKAGESRSFSRSLDLLNPRRPGDFHEDDVVRLSPASEHWQILQSGHHEAAAPWRGKEPPVGIITRMLGTKKDGRRKYEVAFEGLDKDGYTEDELELIRQA